MNIRLIIALFILLLAIPAQGQRKNVHKAQRVKKLSPEEQMRLEKLERMKSAMQKVTIIDSIVVNKDDVLQHYHLSPETGTIKDGNDFAHKKEHNGYFMYFNEIGSKCYFSKQETDSTSSLYYRESVDNEWLESILLPGINDEQQFRHVNYPYMMGDGTTFYFAADGDEDGLGGYDIYMTTYDKEDNHFLRPVNIGLPFNSEANDYLYVIDEYANLGWFATDRNQEEGKVCIYVFIPSEKRETYDAENYTPEELDGIAQISCIADTWNDEKQLKSALQRLDEVRKLQQTKDKADDISFVINDDITYHQVSDFKLQENVIRYQQLVALRSRQANLDQSLDKSRETYHSASKKKQRTMTDDILSDEQEVLTLYQAIHDLEKTIRNTENTFLTKNK
jgi:hypothetical protein